MLIIVFSSWLEGRILEIFLIFLIFFFMNGWTGGKAGVYSGKRYGVGRKRMA